MNNNRSCHILCWNIRGINSNLKWLALSNKIAETSCAIICLQETKRENFEHFYLRKFCPKRFDKFAFQPSVGASGGLITIWNSAIVTGSVVSCLPYSITVKFTSTSSSNDSWLLSNIYGPCSGELRDEFVNWMYNLDIDADQNWMFMGDFNFIRSIENRTLMKLSVMLV